jgi:hypothetical protein
MRGLRHAGLFVDFCEDCDDGSAVIVGDSFDFCLCGCERLRGNGFVCVEEGLDDFGYGALEEPCVVIDEVGEAVFIEGGVDLLDDGSLDEVACIECDKIVFETSSGVFDLCSCGVRQIWQDGKDGARDSYGTRGTNIRCRVLLWVGRPSVGWSHAENYPNLAVLIPTRSRSGVSGTHAGQNFKHGRGREWGVSESVVSRHTVRS